MLKISKITHRGYLRILIHFDYDAEVIARVKTLPFCRYSKTHKGWHIPYTKDAYRSLVALNYKIVILKDSGTAHSSDHTGIERGSHTVFSQIPKDREAGISSKGRNIVLNNQFFRLSIPFDIKEVVPSVLSLWYHRRSYFLLDLY